MKMMKFNKCPRCGARAFERLKTYGQCFECNFNTVEGFTWGDKDGRIAKELYNNLMDEEKCDPPEIDGSVLNFEDQTDPPEAD